MKKNFWKMIALMLCLCLVVGIFSGCGSSEDDDPYIPVEDPPVEEPDVPDIPDIPEVSEIEMSGTWLWSDETGEGEFIFTPDWVEFGYSDGTTGGVGTAPYTATEEGVSLAELDIEAFGDGWFYFMDAGTMVANNGVVLTLDPSASNNGRAPIDIENSLWTLAGVDYFFFDDGTMEAKAEGRTEAGGYTWNGTEGAVHMQGVTTAMYLSPDKDLYMQGEDGYDYLMTYIGPCNKEEIDEGDVGYGDGDWEIIYNDDGTMTYKDYIRNVSFKCPDWMDIMTEGIGDTTDAVIVTDGEDGYVIGDNVTNEWYDYPGSDEDFLVDYIDAYLPEFFVPLYGDWDDFTMELVDSDASGRLATCELNLWNDIWDIQISVLLYTTDGGDIMVKTFFADYYDDDQFRFLWDNVVSLVGAGGAG